MSTADSDKNAGQHRKADAQHGPVCIDAAIRINGSNGPDGGKRRARRQCPRR